MTETRIITKYECKRCKWSWWSKTEKLPTVCPNCKSPYWAKERKGGRPKLNENKEATK